MPRKMPKVQKRTFDKLKRKLSEEREYCFAGNILEEKPRRRKGNRKADGII